MNQKSERNEFMNQEPVPIPAAMRWREFRIRFVPVIIFALALLTVLWLWEERVKSPDFVGRVMADHRVVSTSAQGILTGYDYRDFEYVEAGNILGTVAVSQPELLQARINMVQAEMEVIRTDMQTVASMQRNTLNYTGLLLDEMQIRSEIASLRIELRRAEREFERSQQLFRRDLIEASAFELIEAERDYLESQIQEKEQVADQLSGRLNNLRLSESFDDTMAESAIQAAIKAKEAELILIETELRPMIIRAPISGVLNLTSRRNGEYVSPGDTIAVIQSTQPEYIVGYLRQPFSVSPEVGMKVEIRSRKPSRNRYESVITELGAHISPITREMQRPGINFESGMPVKVALNTDTEFYPGEIVDLILQP